MVLASKVQIVKRDQRSGNVGSKKRAHVNRPLVSFANLTPRTSGQAAKYDSKWWPSLERNFSAIGCTLEAKTMVSNSTQYYLFIGDFKKYTVSGVTFSFNIPHSRLLKNNKITHNGALTGTCYTSKLV